MAEQTIEWDSKTTELGLNALRMGIIYIDNFTLPGSLMLNN
ncbi:MAG: hypothetical protein QX198_08340 [Methylococcaceae bacterium]